MEATTPEQDSGLECLVRIARVHGVPADAAQLRHEFADTEAALSPRALLHAARRLGLKARWIRSTWARLPSTPLPAMVRYDDGRCALLAGVRAEDVLVQAPGQAPSVLSRAAFAACWRGDLLLIARRATSPAGARHFDFGWFLPAILRYRGLLAEVLLASFVLQLFALVSPIFFQVVVDKVLVHRGLGTLDVLCAGLLIISLFEVLLGLLRSYILNHTTNRIDVRLGADLFQHLLRLPIAYFEARRVGDTVARVRELESIRSFLTGAALTLAIDAVFVLVFLAMLVIYSPALSLVVLASLPCYLLIAAGVTPLLRRRLEEQFNRGAEAQAYLVESVAGIETLKAAAVEPRHARRWDELLTAATAAGLRTLTLANVAAQLAGLVQKLSTVLLLWYGARLVIEGELSVGELVAFNLFASRVSGPILKLAELWQSFQQAGVSVRRLGDILNALPEPMHQPGRTSPPAIAGAIAFDHVAFRYRPDRADVLNDISFELAPGQFVGIVGTSGSGKSTIARLIQRLHVPSAGRVLVDGQDLAIVDPAWLRRQIGVVLQENRLFNRPVRENIALRDPALPMARVIEAAVLAGAHDFIQALPDAYDTVVGEFGASLSGGQKQRIALARALITDPRILILDEATSALDYESEALIQRNMRRIANGRTVIVIAHRLTAVRHADVILVLEQGRISERGTHHALLAQGGCYARLHRHQVEGVVITPSGA